MAKTVFEMIEEFKSFISFVTSLKEQDEELWNKPIAEGKWSIKDVICHIMLWDKYFYEEAIQKIILKEPLTARHLNFNDFNANAIEYAKTETKESIFDQFVQCRLNIINSIQDLSEEELLQEYIDGDKKKFSIKRFLRGFIPHDKHHRKQIEKFLKSVTSV